MKGTALIALAILVSAPAVAICQDIYDGDVEGLRQALRGGSYCRVWPGTYDLTGYDWPVDVEHYFVWLEAPGGPDSTIIIGNESIQLLSIGDDHSNDLYLIWISGLTFQDFGSFWGEPAVPHGGLSTQFSNCVFDMRDPLDTDDCVGFIEDCEFRNADGWAVQWSMACGLEFRGNEFHHNGGGIRGFYPAWYIDNHFHHNGIAIQGDGGIRAEGNLIESNEIGLRIGLTTLGLSYVRANTIVGNGIGIQYWFYNSVHPNFNTIHSNTEYNVACEYCGSCNADVTMNWWGTTDAEAIASTIEPGCANFEPFCETPDCGVSPVQGTSWGKIKAIYR